MAIPSSSNRGVLGRIGSTQAIVAPGLITGPSGSTLPYPTTTTVSPLGWLGVFNTGRYLTFLDSGTFTATLSGYYRVRVLGAGGGGATINGDGKRATGGGGGGYALGVVWLTQGQAVSVTVGRGGAGIVSGQTANAGGTSSFGALLSATGGAGGICADNNALIGAAGGVGSGGSLINANGGRSGSIDAGTSSSATGGGGAGSQLGNGGDAGSISGSNSGNAATGGGAVGGVPSANIIRSGSPLVTGGAGVAGTSSLQFGGLDLLAGFALQSINGTPNSSSAVFRFPGDGFSGGGGGPSYISSTSAGAGGTGAGGGALYASNGAAASGAGGVFGGTGGCTSPQGIGLPKPGFGGGGGGVAGINGGSSIGGDGLVVVEW